MDLRMMDLMNLRGGSPSLSHLFLCDRGGQVTRPSPWTFGIPKSPSGDYFRP
jgi:hypothetical protein